MKKTVMIAGAGDAVGIRLVNDFLKKGYTVAAALLKGQEAELPEGVFALTIDPLSEGLINMAANAVEEMFGSIDMLVVNVDNNPEPDPKTILDEPDFEAMKLAYEYNSIGPLRIIDAFLPLLEKGEGKRICVVTSVDSSNYMTSGIDDYPGHVSKAPLNMAMHLLFNGLRPKGFTFRMYAKDPKAAPDRAGEFAVEQFVRDRAWRREWEARKDEIAPYKLTDENRYVLRDWMGTEIPW